MIREFIPILFLISLQITDISCSGSVTDCFSTDNKNDSLVFVCEESQEPYTKMNCIARIFDDIDYLIYRTTIKCIKLGECRGENLSRDLFKTFTNLQQFDISFYGTEYITAETLELGNLKKFNASHNKITSLPNSIFINLKKIIELDLSFNALTNLNPSHFDGVTQVTTMKFSNNMINGLEAETFRELHELKVLDLSVNSIATIVESQFEFNKKLKNLRLKDNPITRFDGNIFWPLLNSVSFDISCTEIEEFDTSGLQQSLTTIAYN